MRETTDAVQLVPIDVSGVAVEKLIHVIYLSAANIDVKEDETLTFLKHARMANRKHDVSGMLLYIGGLFLQLLEGTAAKVNVVSSTIFRDKRNMRLILREPIIEREFPEWTMGFEAIDAQEAGRLLGEPDLFEQANRCTELSPDNAKTLLSLIGRRRWQADRSGIFHAIRRADRV